MTANVFPEAVLIVDDQPTLALMTETMLVEIGVEKVTTAGSVAEALTSIDRTTFDLAILDYDLGVETGWSVAQRLCEEGIRMIISTERDGIMLPAACGSAAILRRPYDLNKLAALVAQQGTA